MKKCNACKIEKPFSEFHRRGSGYQTECKSCKKIRDKKRWDDNPEYETRIRRVRRERLRDLVRELKKQPCTDCKRCFHPAAMDWDHLSDKSLNLADAVRLGWSEARLLTEIAKCELVCSNCHRVRTYNRRNRNMA